VKLNPRYLRYWKYHIHRSTYPYPGTPILRPYCSDARQQRSPYRSAHISSQVPDRIILLNRFMTLFSFSCGISITEPPPPRRLPPPTPKLDSPSPTIDTDTEESPPPPAAPTTLLLFPFSVRTLSLRLLLELRPIEPAKLIARVDRLGKGSP
jgi:hypothetical protein